MKMTCIPLLVTLSLAGCEVGEEEEEVETDELYTAPSGVTGIVRGQASTAYTEMEYEWFWLDYEIDSEDTPDGRVYLTMQDVIFSPGGHTGWHTHAGPTVAMVTQGTLTVYRSRFPCIGIKFRAGQSFIDGPAMGNHIARNNTDGETVVQLLHHLPTATTPFRVDQPAPYGAYKCW